MSVTQRELAPDLWLVETQGRLDQALSPLLEEMLNDLLELGHNNIIIDLTLATYINSGGLRCLLTGWRRARAAGGDVVICGLESRLAEVFEMVGLDQVMIIYDTPADAQEHVFN